MVRITKPNPLSVWLFLLYACTAGVGAVYNTYIPVYFKEIGFSGAMIGTLMATGPLMILIAQPFWGMWGDRTRSVNWLLRLMLIGTTVLVACYPFTRNYTVLLFMLCVFSFFNSPLFMMQDVMTLQAIENTTARYGTARMGSTLGFAAMSALAGVIVNRNTLLMFPLTAGFAVLSIVLSLKVPNVRGHQTRQNRVSPLVLFKHRELLILTAVSFFAMISLGYYSSFFSIFFGEVGGDKSELGIYWFISAIAEVPFLLLAERIVRRLTVRYALLLATLVMGVRWLLLFLLTNKYAIMATSVMHGFSFIVIIYCMAVFINKEMPPELKSSGQSFFALFGAGIPRITASVVGGFANDLFGIRPIFLICALLNILIVVVIGGLFWLKRSKPAAELTQG